MARYGKKASSKVKRAMHERKRGTLRSGSGAKVKSRKQAIAIGLSEARREGGKVPSRAQSKSKPKSKPKSKSTGRAKAQTKAKATTKGSSKRSG